jgi:hypothetical protein
MHHARLNIANGRPQLGHTAAFGRQLKTIHGAK